MACEFTAANVAVTLHDGVLIASFVDDPAEPGQYLIAQRGSRPSTQDVELGHDKPHLEFGGQAHGGYAVPLRVTLTEESIELLLDPADSSRLGIDPVLQIRWAPGVVDTAGIEEELRTLFRGPTEFLCR